MTRLKDLIASKGISTGAISRATGVHKAEVGSFINGGLEKCSKKTRRILRAYFIEQGYLPKPKPRKPPTCRRCGCLYPIRAPKADVVARLSPENHAKLLAEYPLPIGGSETERQDTSRTSSSQS